jgi:hypothetical protein
MYEENNVGKQITPTNLVPLLKNDAMTERQHLFSMTGETISLAFYQNLKHAWTKEQHAEWCSRNGRNGVAWKKVGIWDFRGL